MGSETSHGPEHYAALRERRRQAGVKTRYFRIRDVDEAKVEALMQPYVDAANEAYQQYSEDYHRRLQAEEEQRTGISVQEQRG